MSLAANINQSKLIRVYRQIKDKVPDLSMLGSLNDILFLKILIWAIIASVGVIASIWGGLTVATIVFAAFATKYNLVIGLLYIKVAGVVLAAGCFTVFSIVALAAVS